MVDTTLRRVGGSVMMAVPPAILELLHLRAGAAVRLSVEDGRLVVTGGARPRYALEDLLAQCDADAEPSLEDREWLSAPPVGDEIL